MKVLVILNLVLASFASPRASDPDASCSREVYFTGTGWAITCSPTIGCNPGNCAPQGGSCGPFNTFYWCGCSSNSGCCKVGLIPVGETLLPRACGDCKTQDDDCPPGTTCILTVPANFVRSAVCGIPEPPG